MRRPGASLASPLAALAASAFVATGVATAGCAAEGDSPFYGTTTRPPRDVATFYVNNGSEPEYLDPGKANDSASSTLVLQLFEGLTVMGPKDAHPVQGVATHWEQSDDNRIFRFHLRPEARWSDGKPVTAHDFAYAWKRVLRPRTASLAATNLYPLKNGEPFNQGRLKVASADLPVRRSPRAGEAPAGTLPKGTAVLVLARSPKKVATAIRPLPTRPEGVRAVSILGADAKAGRAESLSLGGGAVVSAEGDGWRGAEVDVIGRGDPVDCDGAPDRWYEVARGDERGFLPGCLLEPSKSEKVSALVARHDALPTFRPGLSGAPPGDAAAPSSDEPSPLGFVDESGLVEDDAVLGVRAAGDLVLEVELERPTPWFLDLTTSPTLAPVRRDVIEPFEARGEPDLWTRPETIVTNGPYTLESWKFRYEITMKANPHYHDREKLRIERIVWLEVEEYHATMNLYRTGEIDTIGDNLSLPSEYMPVLEKKKDFQRFDYLSTYWYELNTKVKPLDDVRVRRALNQAVDKRQLVDRVTRAGQLPATHYVPDFTGLGYAEQAKADAAAGVDPFAGPDLAFDPERARALLREAGYEVVREGEGFRAVGFPPLEILYNTSEGHRQVAVAIQDMWKRHLGISATLRNEEWKVMLKNLRDGHFQVARFGWVADFNHAHTWLDTFLSYSHQNHTGWADQTFDELVREAAATADPKESIRRYRAAEKRATDGMARIPLYFYTKSTLVKPWVKGFYGNARNQHLVKWLWIDPAFERDPTNPPAYEPAELPPPGRLVAESGATP